MGDDGLDGGVYFGIVLSCYGDVGELTDSQFVICFRFVCFLRKPFAREEL